jgi:5-methylcytosine-specific restriction endonuclease McrA
VNTPSTKTCGACGRELPITEFRVKRDPRCAKPQTSSDCNACHKAYNEAIRRRDAAANGKDYRTREDIARDQASRRDRREVDRAARATERRARPRKTREETIQRKVDYQRHRYATDPEYQARIKAKKIKRKRAIEGAFVEPVNRELVAKRDGWRCGICGKKVTRRTWSLDHIVPLAAGGEHSHRNVTLAHRRCNCARGAGRLAVQRPLIAGVVP